MFVERTLTTVAIEFPVISRAVTEVLPLICVLPVKIEIAFAFNEVEVMFVVVALMLR